MAGEEVWECDFQGMKSYGAYGPRDVLILKGSESLEGPDIVARKKGELTQEDRDRMDSEGIPLECWEDEALLVRARYDKDSRYKKITLIEGDLLETEDILDAIRTIFKQTSQPGGKEFTVCPYCCEHGLKKTAIAHKIRSNYDNVQKLLQFLRVFVI